jgi:protein TonB
MSGLRSLLRLDDKVAAEGRRLQHVGGPSMRWLAPLTLIAAASLHGALLLLPAVRTEATLPPASAAPAFPLVWRAAATPSPQLEPAPPPPAPPPPVTRHETAMTIAVVAPAPISQPPLRARTLTMEPVPEPDPELALTRISAEVEAIIPNPDEPPPFDPGPQLGNSTGVPDPPSLLKQIPPVYPVAARSLRAEGRVTLRLSVLPDGSIGRATVEECSRQGLGFEEAALAAVKRWRYEPAPVQLGARKVTVTVQFQREEVHP